MSKFCPLGVAVLLVAMLALAGCGSNTPTSVTEDTTPPAAIVGLQTSVAIGSLSSVTLHWKQSPELDLAGYRVYRRAASGGDLSLVSSGMNPGFVDNQVTQGSSYVYQVAAFDQSNNESARASATVSVVLSRRSGDNHTD